MSAVIIIGIDPGTHTGVAVYDAANRVLTEVMSMPIHEAMSVVDGTHRAGRIKMVVYEDARLRTWFGRKGRESLQGAGSIKRDCVIWADYLVSLGAPHKAVKPSAGNSKWDAGKFARITGWVGRTNEHGRDAALLVWGMR